MCNGVSVAAECSQHEDAVNKPQAYIKWQSEGDYEQVISILPHSGLHSAAMQTQQVQAEAASLAPFLS